MPSYLDSSLNLDESTRRALRAVVNLRIELFGKLLKAPTVFDDTKKSIAVSEVSAFFDEADLKNPHKQSVRSSIYHHVLLKNLLPVIDDEKQQAVFRCVLHDLQHAFPADPWARLYLRYALLANYLDRNFVRTFIEQGTQQQRRELYHTLVKVASAGYGGIPQEDQHNHDACSAWYTYNTLVSNSLLEHLSAILQRELADGDTDWVLQQMSSLNDLNKNILSTPYDPTKPYRMPFNRIFSHFAYKFYESQQAQAPLDEVTQCLLSIADASDGLIVLGTIIQADCVPLEQKLKALDIFLNKYDYNLPFFAQSAHDRSFYGDNYFYDIFLSIIRNRQTDQQVRDRMIKFLENLSQQHIDLPQKTDKTTEQKSSFEVAVNLHREIENLFLRRVERSYLAQFLQQYNQTLALSTIRTFLKADGVFQEYHTVINHFRTACETYIRDEHTREQQIFLDFKAKLLRNFIDYFFAHADEPVTTEQLITDFFNVSPSAE